MPGDGGCRCACQTMTPTINNGSRLNGKFSPGIMNTVSGFDRSATHRKCAPRNSIALRSIVKKPKNTGI